MKSLSRDEVRDIDRRAVEEFGVPSLVLMENAGRGAADWLVTLGVKGPVAICCGKGNNGGDGLVLARRLTVLHVPAMIHLFADPNELSADARAQWNIVSRFQLPRRVWPANEINRSKLAGAWHDAEWLVDGLYGTGLTGPIRPPLDRVIDALNAAAARKLALDLPSGLDADTGLPLGAVFRATHTITFAARKKGFDNPASVEFTGAVQVADIGIPHFPASQP